MPPEPTPSGVPAQGAPLQRIHPSKIHHPPNHGREQDVADLVENLGSNSQYKPVTLSRHPDNPGEFVCIDGNRTVQALRILGREVIAIVIDREVSSAEARKIRLSCNAARKQMTSRQLAEDVACYIDETGCTQAKAAAELGFKESTVSRWLNRNALAEAERNALDVAGVGFTIQTMIAAESGTVRAKAITFALGEGGKRPSKEAVASFIQRDKRLKDGNPKGRKPSKFTVKHGGFELTVKPKEGASTEDIAAHLEELARRLRKNKSVPIEGLRFLFG